MITQLQDRLSLPYGQLEELNLKAKEQRKNRVDPGKIQEERLKYLTDEKRIKAVTVLFSDLEGRLHMLDYDKKFLLKSWDNLTFDGSSIRGFTAEVVESPLDLNPKQGLQGRYAEKAEDDTMDLHFILRIVHDRGAPG